jgi:hypothetical protein
MQHIRGIRSLPAIAVATFALVATLGGAAWATIPGASFRDLARPVIVSTPQPRAVHARAALATPGVRIVRAAGHIRAAVGRFRSLLGPDDGGGPVGRAQGRREISWDSVPDQFAEPNALPGDFFNAPTAPRARGALLSTPGDHVAVSARAGNPYGAAVRFGDINPSYPSRFRTFSPPRLFSPIGSNIVNLTFRVPGTRRHAVVRGFGAVYTDVDLPEKTGFRYYDIHGRLLGAFTVPAAPRGLSFLGVRFPTAVVARVRIEYGNHALGPNDSARVDVAVMDNFIYGEPQPAPR